MRKSLLLSVTLGCILLSNSPAWGTYCYEHEDCKIKWDIREGDDIDVKVWAQVGRQGTEKRVLAARRPVGLGAAGIDWPVSFRVEATDWDMHVCETGNRPVRNRLMSTTVGVDIYIEGQQPKVASITLDPQGDGFHREWTGSWPVPASAAGKWLRFELTGSVDDADCQAEKHLRSHDTSVDMSRFMAKLSLYLCSGPPTRI